MSFVKTTVALFYLMLGPLQHSYYASGCNSANNGKENVYSCGGTVIGEGTIQSPDFPIGIFCRWSLQASPEEGLISLRFKSFNIDPYHDIFVISDDDGSVRKFSGRVQASTVSFGKRAVITAYFNPDWPDRRTPPGFKIEFTTTTGPVHPCGSFITGEGVLQSPNYPNPYPYHLTCNWTLQASPVEGFVSLRFTNFSTEHEYDHVDIIEKDVLLHRFSGDVPPSTHSVKKEATIIFTTDASIQRIGFQIRFTTKGHPCGDTIRGSGLLQSENYPELYSNNVACTWTLVASPDEGHIFLQFISFSTEEHYDFVVIDDDDESPPRRITGPAAPPALTLGRRARVHFATDTSIVSTGFQIIFTTENDECSLL